MTDHDAVRAAEIDAIRARADVRAAIKAAEKNFRPGPDGETPLQMATCAALEPFLEDLDILLADRDALAAFAEWLIDLHEEGRLPGMRTEHVADKARAALAGKHLVVARCSDCGKTWTDQHPDVCHVAAISADRDVLAAKVAELRADFAVASDAADNYAHNLTAARAEVERQAAEKQQRNAEAQRIAKYIKDVQDERDKARAEVERLTECLRHREDYLQRQVDGQRSAALSWQEGALAARARVAGLEAELAEAQADADDLAKRLSRKVIADYRRDNDTAPPAAPVPTSPPSSPDERNPVSGLIGLLATGHTDLARRAKDIVRGRDQL